MLNYSFSNSQVACDKFSNSHVQDCKQSGDVRGCTGRLVAEPVWGETVGDV